ncbi:MAG: T9SS type A sorting domain-containing protein, partial [Endomicrobiia bacterium]
GYNWGNFEDIKDMKIGYGRNDFKNRIYVLSSVDKSIYEITYTGQWEIVIFGSEPFFHKALTIGTGRNDEIWRVYTANSDGYMYEYQFSGTVFQKKGNYYSGMASMLNCITIGDARNYGLNCVYSGNSAGRLYEFRWTGSTWTVSEIYSFSSSINDVVIGDGRNDGKNRIYIACGNNKVYELEYYWPKPSDFTGVALSTYSIMWSWKDNATDEAGYQVRDQNGLNLSGNLQPNTTYWIEKNLTANSRYTRYAYGWTNAGDFGDSNLFSRFTLANIPDNLTGFPRGSTSVGLSWSGDGSRYAIQRANDLNGGPSGWEDIVSWEDNLNVSNYTDTGLLPETTYWYRVLAYNGDGILSEASKEIALRTRPLPVRNLVGIAISTYSIKWQWEDMSKVEYGYRVYSSTGGILVELSPDTTYWVQSGLSANRRYGVYVVAYDYTGESDIVFAYRYTLANIPFNLAFSSATENTITFSWVGDGSRYAIERAIDVGGTPGNWIRIVSWEDNFVDVSYTDVNLLPSTTYWYRIRAYNAEMIFTDASIEKPYKTTPMPPLIVLDDGVWSSTTTIKFYWQLGSGDIVSYHLQVGTIRDGNDKFDGEIGYVSSYTILNCNHGKTYYARVRVKDHFSNYSNWSNSSDGITIDIVPPQTPSITSFSHPETDLDYINDYAEFGFFSLDDLSLVEYYYILKTSYTEILKGSTYYTSLTFEIPEDGIYYFCIFAKDEAGNMSTTAERRIKVSRRVIPTVENVKLLSNIAKIIIPAGAIATEKFIFGRKMNSFPDLPFDKKLYIKPSELGVKFYFSDKENVYLNKQATLYIYFNDFEIVGLDKNKLKLFYLDENNNWNLIEESEIVSGPKNTLIAKIHYLSTFRIMEYTGIEEEIENVSNYPNPFESGGYTKIRYYLSKNTDVEVKIYNIFGKLVWEKNVKSGEKGGCAGPNEIYWYGKDNNDNFVGTGVYICVIKTPSGVIKKRTIGVK